MYEKRIYSGKCNLKAIVFFYYFDSTLLLRTGSKALECEYKHALSSE